MTGLKKASLVVLGLGVCLFMIGLGNWQLSRAAEKQAILEQVLRRATMEPVNLGTLLPDADSDSFAKLVYTPIFAVGTYSAQHSIFIDNKVLASKVGYKLLTPFKIADSDWWVLVDRGWLPVGELRSKLPVYTTEKREVQLSGRLNSPAAKPPLWNDKYPVSQGAVWQYLPITKYAKQMELNLLPLVLELAPIQDSELDQNLSRQWAEIDDHWVAKHKGYAFQWFAMAFAFFVACSVLVYRSFRSAK